MNLGLRISLLFSHRSLFNLQAVVAFLLLSSTVAAQAPQPDVRQLTIGEKIERKVLNQELHLYTVELKRGQVLRVNILEKGADVSAVMMRVANEQRASAAANFGNGFMRESLTLIPEQDGAYALVVLAQQITDSNVAARYEVEASLNDSASGKDTQRLQAEKLLDEGTQLFSVDNKNNLPSAIAKWEESIKIWKTLGESYWEAIAKASIGSAFYKAENYGKSELYFNEALRFFEETKNEPGVASISVALASIYSLINDEEKAIAYFNRALKISKSLGDKRSEAIILGALKSNEPDSPGNGQNYAQELSKARARDDKVAEAMIWAQTVFRFAMDDSIAEDVRRAFFDKAAQEALPMSKAIKSTEIEMLLLLGLGMGYSDTAVSMNADEAEEKADLDKSLNYLIQALLISEVTGRRQIQAFSYLVISGIYDDNLEIYFGKKAINSTQDIRQNLKNLDKETQQNYARKVQEGYGDLASSLFFGGRLAEAHQVINFSRDQEFFDFTQLPNQAPSKLTLTPREAENDQMLNNAIQSIIAKYANRPEPDYRKAADELKTTFRKLEQNFAAPSSVKDVAGIVPDTADLQFALSELSSKTGKKHAAIYFVSEVGEILLITPESIKAFARSTDLEELKNYISSEKVDEEILKFLEALRSPDSDPRLLGAQIYSKIFKAKELSKDKSGITLEAELARYKADVLLWSLSGNIRYIPVVALYDAEKKQYLVEKYQNVVFTRARKERFLIEPKPWTQCIGFGTSTAHKIDFNGRHLDFSPLPGVTTELSAIFGDAATKQKGLFKGQVFLNRGFTRQALLTIMQTKPSLAHIASHFSFQPGDAQNSFLLLGDGNRFSLYDMQQNPRLFEGVDLLTLSACETAAQQPGANGKEIDGFAELAQRLGASSVIATLWKVSDHGTSQLMIEFYRLRQANPNATKSEILRQAQLNLMNGESTEEEGARRRASRRADLAVKSDEKGKTKFKPADESPFEHPYYWAPFVLFGSSR